MSFPCFVIFLLICALAVLQLQFCIRAVGFWCNIVVSLLNMSKYRGSLEETWEDFCCFYLNFVLNAMDRMWIFIKNVSEVSRFLVEV